MRSLILLTVCSVISLKSLSQPTISYDARINLLLAKGLECEETLKVRTFRLNACDSIRLKLSKENDKLERKVTSYESDLFLLKSRSEGCMLKLGDTQQERDKYKRRNNRNRAWAIVTTATTVIAGGLLFLSIK